MGAKFAYTKFSDRLAEANNVDPDQNTASDQVAHCATHKQFFDISADS